MSKDGVFRIPEPLKQTLMLTSEHMISAVEQLGRRIPDFDKFFPNFDPDAEIPAPYTFIYHSIPLFDHVVPHLTPLGIELLEMLNENVLASHGKEYLAAKQYQAKGIVSRRLVKYLVRPGDVLVSTQDSVPLAYVATTWAKEEAYKEDVSNPDEGRLHKITAEKHKGPKIRTYNFRVAAWSWAFDGSFEQKRITIQIQLKVGDEDDEVSITSLNYFPLRFDTNGLQQLLEERGNIFWKCRTKRLVSYSDDDNVGLNSVSIRQKPYTMLHHQLIPRQVDERYMIDINTYKTLHRDSQLWKTPLRPDIDAEAMAKDTPPGSGSLLVFPSTVIGFNLRTKTWRTHSILRPSPCKPL